MTTGRRFAMASWLLESGNFGRKMGNHFGLCAASLPALCASVRGSEVEMSMALGTATVWADCRIGWCCC